jgi:hypothetical protein
VPSKRAPPHGERDGHVAEGDAARLLGDAVGPVEHECVDAPSPRPAHAHRDLHRLWPGDLGAGGERVRGDREEHPELVARLVGEKEPHGAAGAERRDRDEPSRPLVQPDQLERRAVRALSMAATGRLLARH